MEAVVLAILGAIMGSFANVCIYRLPRDLSIAWPPSNCPGCKERIRPWDMVPVLSWLWLRGRCRNCQQPISWQYPLVELTMALVFGAIGWSYGLSLEALSAAVLSFALLVAVGTDLGHRIIPDSISLGAAAVLAGLALARLNWGLFFGGGLLFMILFLIALASRGGMGGGDIKLALVIGLGLGWKLGLTALLLAFLAGGLVAGGLMIFRKADGKNEVPFGPFLAAGAFTALFFGHQLIEGWWQLTLLLGRW